MFQLKDFYHRHNTAETVLFVVVTQAKTAPNTNRIICISDPMIQAALGADILIRDGEAQNL